VCQRLDEQVIIGNLLFFEYWIVCKIVMLAIRSFDSCRVVRDTNQIRSS
jgi:hypothetical protein